MIRRIQRSDGEEAAGIWLEANLTAHDFIPRAYWEGHFPAVKELLPEAEVYVYEDGRLLGLIGLNGDHIEGLFAGARSRGIGRALLDFAKERRDRLTLQVYQKNTRAVRFYQREGFQIQEDRVDESTGEREYRMLWRRSTD